ncbi:hypothetical protein P7K49_007457 [Saguinus oedipus]|uniref:Uncharacterized protein n=1 Tax=Saguinus oedipus TaxID=9490 RepID=A0ABQ9VUX4_SAGOE|nr:hypothetical protein P7K49_007457 [Saguinus oedipus]
MAKLNLSNCSPFELANYKSNSTAKQEPTNGVSRYLPAAFPSGKPGILDHGLLAKLEEVKFRSPLHSTSPSLNSLSSLTRCAPNDSALYNILATRDASGLHLYLKVPESLGGEVRMPFPGAGLGNLQQPQP